MFSIDGPWSPILLPICGALFAIAVAKSPAAAGEAQAASMKSSMIFILQSEGYGVSECLTTSLTCGRVVADSWCSAKGHGKAIAWGKTDDMTASTGIAAAKKPPAGALAISCAE